MVPIPRPVSLYLALALSIFLSNLAHFSCVQTYEGTQWNKQKQFRKIDVTRAIGTLTIPEQLAHSAIASQAGSPVYKQKGEGVEPGISRIMNVQNYKCALLHNHRVSLY